MFKGRPPGHANSHQGASTAKSFHIISDSSDDERTTATAATRKTALPSQPSPNKPPNAVAASPVSRRVLRPTTPPSGYSPRPTKTYSSSGGSSVSSSHGAPSLSGAAGHAITVPTQRTRTTALPAPRASHPAVRSPLVHSSSPASKHTSSVAKAAAAAALAAGSSSDSDKGAASDAEALPATANNSPAPSSKPQQAANARTPPSRSTVALRLSRMQCFSSSDDEAQSPSKLPAAREQKSTPAVSSPSAPSVPGSAPPQRRRARMAMLPIRLSASSDDEHDGAASPLGQPSLGSTRPPAPFHQRRDVSGGGLNSRDSSSGGQHPSHRTTHLAALATQHHRNRGQRDSHDRAVRTASISTSTTSLTMAVADQEQPQSNSDAGLHGSMASSASGSCHAWLMRQDHDASYSFTNEASCASSPAASPRQKQLQHRPAAVQAGDPGIAGKEGAAMIHGLQQPARRRLAERQSVSHDAVPPAEPVSPVLPAAHVAEPSLRYLHMTPAAIAAALDDMQRITEETHALSSALLSSPIMVRQRQRGQATGAVQQSQAPSALRDNTQGDVARPARMRSSSASPQRHVSHGVTEPVVMSGSTTMPQSANGTLPVGLAAAHRQLVTQGVILMPPSSSSSSSLMEAAHDTLLSEHGDAERCGDSDVGSNSSGSPRRLEGPARPMGVMPNPGQPQPSVHPVGGVPSQEPPQPPPTRPVDVTPEPVQAQPSPTRAVDAIPSPGRHAEVSSRLCQDALVDVVVEGCQPDSVAAHGDDESTPAAQRQVQRRALWQYRLAIMSDSEPSSPSAGSGDSGHSRGSELSSALQSPPCAVGAAAEATASIPPAGSMSRPMSRHLSHLLIPDTSQGGVSVASSMTAASSASGHKQQPQHHLGAHDADALQPPDDHSDSSPVVRPFSTLGQAASQAVDRHGDRRTCSSVDSFTAPTAAVRRWSVAPTGASSTAFDSPRSHQAGSPQHHSGNLHNAAVDGHLSPHALRTAAPSASQSEVLASAASSSPEHTPDQPAPETVLGHPDAAVPRAPVCDAVVQQAPLEHAPLEHAPLELAPPAASSVTLVTLPSPAAAHSAARDDALRQSKTPLPIADAPAPTAAAVSVVQLPAVLPTAEAALPTAAADAGAPPLVQPASVAGQELHAAAAYNGPRDLLVVGAAAISAVLASGWLMAGRADGSSASPPATSVPFPTDTLEPQGATRLNAAAAAAAEVSFVWRSPSAAAPVTQSHASVPASPLTPSSVPQYDLPSPSARQGTPKAQTLQQSFFRALLATGQAERALTSTTANATAPQSPATSAMAGDVAVGETQTPPSRRLTHTSLSCPSPSPTSSPEMTDRWSRSPLREVVVVPVRSRRHSSYSNGGANGTARRRSWLQYQQSSRRASSSSGSSTASRDDRDLGVPVAVQPATAEWGGGTSPSGAVALRSWTNSATSPAPSPRGSSGGHARNAVLPQQQAGSFARRSYDSLRVQMHPGGLSSPSSPSPRGHAVHRVSFAAASPRSPAASPPCAASSPARTTFSPARSSASSPACTAAHFVDDHSDDDDEFGATSHISPHGRREAASPRPAVSRVLSCQASPRVPGGLDFSSPRHASHRADESPRHLSHRPEESPRRASHRVSDGSEGDLAALHAQAAAALRSASSAVDACVDAAAARELESYSLDMSHRLMRLSGASHSSAGGERWTSPGCALQDAGSQEMFRRWSRDFESGLVGHDNIESRSAPVLSDWQLHTAGFVSSHVVVPEGGSLYCSSHSSTPSPAAVHGGILRAVQLDAAGLQHNDDMHDVPLSQVVGYIMETLSTISDHSVGSSGAATGCAFPTAPTRAPGSGGPAGADGGRQAAAASAAAVAAVADVQQYVLHPTRPRRLGTRSESGTPRVAFASAEPSVSTPRSHAMSSAQERAAPGTHLTGVPARDEGAPQPTRSLVSHLRQHFQHVTRPSLDLTYGDDVLLPPNDALTLDHTADDDIDAAVGTPTAASVMAAASRSPRPSTAAALLAITHESATSATVRAAPPAARPATVPSAHSSPQWASLYAAPTENGGMSVSLQLPTRPSHLPAPRVSEEPPHLPQLTASDHFRRDVVASGALDSPRSLLGVGHAAALRLRVACSPSAVVVPHVVARSLAGAASTAPSPRGALVVPHDLGILKQEVMVEMQALLTSALSAAAAATSPVGRPGTPTAAACPGAPRIDVSEDSRAGHPSGIASLPRRASALGMTDAAASQDMVVGDGRMTDGSFAAEHVAEAASLPAPDYISAAEAGGASVAAPSTTAVSTVALGASAAVPPVDIYEALSTVCVSYWPQAQHRPSPPPAQVDESTQSEAHHIVVPSPQASPRKSHGGQPHTSVSIVEEVSEEQRLPVDPDVSLAALGISEQTVRRVTIVELLAGHCGDDQGGSADNGRAAAVRCMDVQSPVASYAGDGSNGVGDDDGSSGGSCSGVQDSLTDGYNLLLDDERDRRDVPPAVSASITVAAQQDEGQHDESAGEEPETLLHDGHVSSVESDWGEDVMLSQPSQSHPAAVALVHRLALLRRAEGDADEYDDLVPPAADAGHDYDSVGSLRLAHDRGRAGASLQTAGSRPASVSGRPASSGATAALRHTTSAGGSSGGRPTSRRRTYPQHQGSATTSPRSVAGRGARQPSAGPSAGPVRRPAESTVQHVTRPASSAGRSTACRSTHRPTSADITASSPRSPLPAAARARRTTTGTLRPVDTGHSSHLSVPHRPASTGGRLPTPDTPGVADGRRPILASLLREGRPCGNTTSNLVGTFSARTASAPLQHGPHTLSSSGAQVEVIHHSASRARTSSSSSEGWERGGGGDARPAEEDVSSVGSYETEELLDAPRTLSAASSPASTHFHTMRASPLDAVIAATAPAAPASAAAVEVLVRQVYLTDRFSSADSQTRSDAADEYVQSYGEEALLASSPVVFPEGACAQAADEAVGRVNAMMQLAAQADGLVPNASSSPAPDNRSPTSAERVCAQLRVDTQQLAASPTPVPSSRSSPHRLHVSRSAGGGGPRELQQQSPQPQQQRPGHLGGSGSGQDIRALLLRALQDMSVRHDRQPGSKEGGGGGVGEVGSPEALALLRNPLFRQRARLMGEGDWRDMDAVLAALAEVVARSDGGTDECVLPAASPMAYHNSLVDRTAYWSPLRAALQRHRADSEAAILDGVITDGDASTHDGLEALQASTEPPPPAIRPAKPSPQLYFNPAEYPLPLLSATFPRKVPFPAIDASSSHPTSSEPMMGGTAAVAAGQHGSSAWQRWQVQTEAAELTQALLAVQLRHKGSGPTAPMVRSHAPGLVYSGSNSQGDEAEDGVWSDIQMLLEQAHVLAAQLFDGSSSGGVDGSSDGGGSNSVVVDVSSTLRSYTTSTEELEGATAWRPPGGAVAPYLQSRDFISRSQQAAMLEDELAAAASDYAVRYNPLYALTRDNSSTLVSQAHLDDAKHEVASIDDHATERLHPCAMPGYSGNTQLMLHNGGAGEHHYSGRSSYEDDDVASGESEGGAGAVPCRAAARGPLAPSPLPPSPLHLLAAASSLHHPQALDMTRRAAAPADCLRQGGPRSTGSVPLAGGSVPPPGAASASSLAEQMQRLVGLVASAQRQIEGGAASQNTSVLPDAPSGTAAPSPSQQRLTSLLAMLSGAATALQQQQLEAVAVGGSRGRAPGGPEAEASAAMLSMLMEQSAMLAATLEEEARTAGTAAPTKEVHAPVRLPPASVSRIPSHPSPPRPHAEPAVSHHQIASSANSNTCSAYPTLPRPSASHEPSPHATSHESSALTSNVLTSSAVFADLPSNQQVGQQVGRSSPSLAHPSPMDELRHRILFAQRTSRDSGSASEASVSARGACDRGYSFGGGNASGGGDISSGGHEGGLGNASGGGAAAAVPLWQQLQALRQQQAAAPAGTAVTPAPAKATLPESPPWQAHHPGGPASAAAEAPPLPTVQSLPSPEQRPVGPPPSYLANRGDPAVFAHTLVLRETYESNGGAAPQAPAADTESSGGSTGHTTPRVSAGGTGPASTATTALMTRAAQPLVPSAAELPEGGGSVGVKPHQDDAMLVLQPSVPEGGSRSGFGAALWAARPGGDLPDAPESAQSSMGGGTPLQYSGSLRLQGDAFGSLDGDQIVANLWDADFDDLDQDAGRLPDVFTPQAPLSSGHTGVPSGPLTAAVRQYDRSLSVAGSVGSVSDSGDIYAEGQRLAQLMLTPVAAHTPQQLHAPSHQVAAGAAAPSVTHSAATAQLAAHTPPAMAPATPHRLASVSHPTTDAHLREAAPSVTDDGPGQVAGRSGDGRSSRSTSRIPTRSPEGSRSASPAPPVFAASRIPPPPLAQAVSGTSRLSPSTSTAAPSSLTSTADAAAAAAAGIAGRAAVPSADEDLGGLQVAAIPYL